VVGVSLEGGRMAGAQPSLLVAWAPWCVIDVVRSEAVVDTVRDGENSLRVAS
jgi:hypothetical protein